MPAQSLGPQTRRVYETLRDRIASGTLAEGTRLPPHPALAAEFGVSPVTMRLALVRLADEGYLSSRPGRGTYVQARRTPRVLVVEDDAGSRALLFEHISRAGLVAVGAGSAAEALALLEAEPSVALLLSDVRMPTAEVGIGFIKAVAQRWPDLPVVAVTAYPGDLSALHGSPEWPVLVISKPFHARQIHSALSLALGAPALRGP